MNGYSDDEILKTMARYDPCVIEKDLDLSFDTRAKTDLARILNSPSEAPALIRHKKRGLIIVGAAASIAFATTTAGAAASGFFQSQAHKEFAAPGNNVLGAIAEPNGGKEQVETTMPNGSIVQYWETPSIKNGKVEGACDDLIFNDPGVTTTTPGKDDSVGGGGCYSGGGGIIDDFDFSGTEATWTSPSDGKRYVVSALTSGDAQRVEYHMAGGQVFEATVKNKQSIVVLPKELADLDYTIVGIDKNGHVIGQYQEKSLLGTPG